MNLRFLRIVASPSKAISNDLPLGMMPEMVPVWSHSFVLGFWTLTLSPT